MSGVSSEFRRRLTRSRKRDHAVFQARRRYGVQLSSAAFEDMCEDILSGVAQLVLVQNPGREVWQVTFDGRRMVAVWDTDLRVIVTFLPRQGVPGVQPANDRRVFVRVR